MAAGKRKKSADQASLGRADGRPAARRVRGDQRIFKAISDPTRREIFALLIAATSALTINDISEQFTATRQAVTKHIKILEDAGLITIETRGRERYCSPKPDKLQSVVDWVAYYQGFWNSKMDKLGDFLDSNS